MKNKSLVCGTILLSLLLMACSTSGLSLGSKRVTVTMVYGSEKEAWLKPLVEQFNSEKHKTAAGAVIEVQITPMGSVDSGEQIIAGSLTPTVWSPASSAYAPVVNAKWRQSHSDDLVLGTP